MTRWGILALLFGARTVMAMQYQSIGALSPVLRTQFGIGLTEIGVLIGLYVVPGVVFALPGSAIGQRFGEKPVVVVSCALMGLGALIMANTDAWTPFLIGHLLAGLGGVLINILMTKMVADWFVGAEITTALAVFINSWPFGIALALVVFPPLVGAFGLPSAFWLLTVAALLFAGLVAVFYQSPAETKSAGTTERGWPRGTILTGILAAGLCWGAFNGGLAILFGLGTALLVELGDAPETAARTTSLILWVLAVAAPCGGFLADKTGQGTLMIVVGLLGLAILSPLAVVPGLTGAVFLAYGILSGLVAGPIMSLPARVLPPETRIIGMGLFFTVYYVIFIASPALAGALAEAVEHLPTALWCASALHLAALAGLWTYQRSRTF